MEVESPLRKARISYERNEETSNFRNRSSFETYLNYRQMTSIEESLRYEYSPSGLYHISQEEHAALEKANKIIEYQGVWFYYDNDAQIPGIDLNRYTMREPGKIWSTHLYCDESLTNDEYKKIYGCFNPKTNRWYAKYRSYNH